MTIRFNWKTVALALLILFAIAEVWGAPTAHMSEDLLPLVKGQAGAVDSLVSVVVFLDTDSEAPAMISADRPMTRAERIKTVTRTLRQVRPRAAGSVEAVLGQSAQGPIRRLWIVPAYVALVPVATVDHLSKMDGVKAIVSDLALEFDEPVSVAPAAQASPTLSTHLQLLNIPAVWSRGITGKGRLVCNFDTGVDILHPALSSKWRGNHASLGASWFSPYYPESEPVDRRGHGTHTMGVMVASDGADTVGAAPDAEWIAAAVIDQGDVIIDFTFHKATMEFARLAARHARAMVIGTTGLTAENLAELAELSRNFPCVQAPNMAVGVNVLFKLAAKTASILGDDYDIEIVEAHHNKKKDAPSGTALKLAEMAASGVNRNLAEVGVYERHGMIGERTKKEIGVQTVRAGDIVGEHTIYFAGPGERIEITHRAHSRDNFAKGAATAAAWVAHQKPGLYSMFDVLGLQDL